MALPVVTCRQYSSSDYAACLRIFDANVPRFFRVEEQGGYAEFLANLPGPYLVLIDSPHTVVACGGYAVAEGSSVADLCWGMVDQEHHGRGLGHVLAELRIERIRGDPGVAAIALNTSQHTVSFYERLGFRTIKVEPDGYALGLHRHDMLMELQR